MKWFKASRTWMRVVLPHELVALFVLIAWCAFNAVGLYLVQFGVPGGESSPELALTLINAAIAFLYGAHRSRFHPILSPSYNQWLSHQPWTPDKPFPSGPVFLVWQDAFILAILALPVAMVGQRVEVILIAFLLPLAITWTVLSWFTQSDLFVYLVAFLLPSVLLYITSTLAVLVAVVASAILAAVGVYRGFDLFPWNPESLKPGFRRHWAQVLIAGQHYLGKVVGWPSKHLLDESQWIGVNQFHAVMVAAVLTWWALIPSLLYHRYAKPIDIEPTYLMWGFERYNRKLWMR